MTFLDLLQRVSALVPLTGLEAVSPEVLALRATGVECDSRRVVSGSVFVAIRGERADGASFAPQALARGAGVVLAETAAPAEVASRWITTPDARRALAAVAATFFGHPSEELLAIGITGTNGKTTTSYLLGDILDKAGLRPGRIGTVGYRIGDREYDAARTTPEASDLQRFMREMVEAGCRACAMEVSSHALVLHRVDFVRFSGAIFTNLSRDHLDFHQGMEDYFAAKRRLFDMLPPGAPAVVNLDDMYGARLAADCPQASTYALDREADVAPLRLSLTLDGVTCDLKTPRGPLHLRSPLLGRPNAYNLLSAVSMALRLDVSTEAIEEGCRAMAQVPGRLQRVSVPADDVTVLVDYAHTDDALRNLLETARPLTKGRVITVFGCGGDRDRTKRPLMGAVASRLSDLVILTSDNPRSEDPAAIIEEIKRGLVPPERPLTRNGQVLTPVRATPWKAIVDRRAAVQDAIRQAAPGDLIVVAGKGHEKYQEVAGRTLPFDDVDVAGEALAERRGERSGRPGLEVSR